MVGVDTPTGGRVEKFSPGTIERLREGPTSIVVMRGEAPKVWRV